MPSTKDLLHHLYDLASAAAMRAATWVSSETGVFEGHPVYWLILFAIVGMVYIRLS